MMTIPPSLNRVLNAVINRWDVDLNDEFQVLTEGRQYLVRGYCHQGDGPGNALSITYRPEEQATYLKCHANHGCTSQSILDTLGLSFGHLYDVMLGEEASPAIRVQRSNRKPMRDFLFDKKKMATLPPPKALIDGWMFEKNLVWIAGAPKGGKTLVGVDMAFCMANGINWNMRDTQQGNILYVATEGHAGLNDRLDALEDKYGEPLHSDLDNMTGLIVLAYSPQLLDNDDVDELIEIANEINPLVTFLDTQARMTVGVNENEAMDMGRVVAAADRIKFECDTTVTLVHHINKANEASRVNMRDIRGSGAMAGAADTMIGVHKRDDIVSAYVIDHKEAGHPDTLDWALTTSGESVYLDNGISETPEQRHQAKINDLVSKLRAKGVPLTYGERKAREFLGDDFKARNEDLREALKIYRGE